MAKQTTRNNFYSEQLLTYSDHQIIHHQIVRIMADSSSEKPTILLLCLGGDLWTNVLDKTETFVTGIDLLLEKARLKRAKTLSARSPEVLG